MDKRPGGLLPGHRDESLLSSHGFEAQTAPRNASHTSSPSQLPQLPSSTPEQPANPKNRLLGVSNYGVAHIQEFIDARAAGAADAATDATSNKPAGKGGASKVPELPVLNQLDWHPFMRRPEIVDICEKHGIIPEVSHAFSRPPHLPIPLSVGSGA